MFYLRPRKLHIFQPSRMTLKWVRLSFEQFYQYHKVRSFRFNCAARLGTDKCEVSPSEPLILPFPCRIPFPVSLCLVLKPPLHRSRSFKAVAQGFVPSKMAQDNVDKKAVGCCYYLPPGSEFPMPIYRTTVLTLTESILLQRLLSSSVFSDQPNSLWEVFMLLLPVRSTPPLFMTFKRFVTFHVSRPLVLVLISG